MLKASPDFDLCYLDTGGYDPTCADGYSSVMPLTIPRPKPRYAASTRAYRFLKQIDLRLAVTPLGDKLHYRVCYRLASKQRRCLRGTVDGYDWDARATDTLSLTTRRLAAWTTFTWYVGNKAVAAKRVRT